MAVVIIIFLVIGFSDKIISFKKSDGRSIFWINVGWKRFEIYQLQIHIVKFFPRILFLPQ